jgi:hypothetical protein
MWAAVRDARHLPLPDSTVDAVFAAGLIGHLPDLDPTLNEQLATPSAMDRTMPADVTTPNMGGGSGRGDELGPSPLDALGQSGASELSARPGQVGACEPSARPGRVGDGRGLRSAVRPLCTSLRSVARSNRRSTGKGRSA